eukprot:TRINITY_DN7572_c2_g2_i1.p1 TRINITY_DN7572_c2_g2~~TRINITY_DN7572_c2_g2_i1.p1  ORF type:complete len:283 (+),score=77.26 TRINITY_DN7572_c2_g2_i1:80-928(+)
MAAEAEQNPKKRRSAADWAEQYQKVKKTIGWYNHNGEMAGGQIIYKDVKDIVEAVDPKETLKILHSLEEKKDEVRNPTAWLRSQVIKVGAELDTKVKRVIAWYNKQGTLASPIIYTEVRGPLSQLPMTDQLHILKGLEGKEADIKEPTKWICAAASRRGAAEQSWEPPPQSKGWSKGAGKSGGGSWSSKGSSKGSWGSGAAKGARGSGAASGLDEKVKKTIGWYNRSGLLTSEIRFDEVSSALAQVDTKTALEILKGLETKGSGIRNPSAWIAKACAQFGAQ